ncbi:hypothetical protein [Sphingosinicella xenopeptidilytica]|uniref:Uncharacterized protein n=1 Tax=Sphingosinicella xenopeptidilytica TaxID=364098 RepID=A0ABW3BZH2_SPHXN
MTAPQFVHAAVVHVDTTANASPITTDAYAVSGTGHTLIVVIDHERAHASSPLAITGITRGVQSFTRVNKGDLGSAATVDVADMWVLENAATGSAPLVVSHNGVTGSDIQIAVVEYDGGTPGAVSTPAYVPGSSAAVARFGITVPADARLVYLQVVTAAAGTWTGPSHGTSRLTATVGTGTGGGALAVADYAPASAETLTNVGYAFTPASGSWSNGSNHVVGLILEAAATDAGITPAAGALTHTAGTPLLDTGDLTPTVSRPPGGGDIDVAATVITDPLSAAPTIALFGDPESNNTVSGVKWEGFFAAVDLKQAGRTPTFTLDFSNWRQNTPPANNRLYWRYGSDIGDMTAWQPFESRSVSGSVLTVSNSAAFAEAVIQIANIPPVPYDELEDWLTTWAASGTMFRPQACADLGVAPAAPNAYAYYDFPDLVSPDGIEVGGTFAFAFGITNPAATGAKARLFHTWTHAGEWGGLRAMLRFAERLMSIEDTVHDALRDRFEHIFLLTNTAGMVGGMARGVVESGDIGDDPNRVWGSHPTDRDDVSDPILSIEASIALLVTEWGVNDAGLLNCAGQLAWHSHTSATAKFGAYKGGLSSAESAFMGHTETLYGTSLHDHGSSSAGSSTHFARVGTAGGFGVTFEWSYAWADFLSEIGASVDTIGPALVETLDAGWLGAALSPAAAAHAVHSGAAALVPRLAPAGAVLAHHGGAALLSLAGQIAAASGRHGHHAAASLLTAAGVVTGADASLPHRATRPVLSTGFIPPAASGAVLRVRPDTRVLSVGAA